MNDYLKLGIVKEIWIRKPSDKEPLLIPYYLLGLFMFFHSHLWFFILLSFFHLINVFVKLENVLLV
jgi:hypothetical protein